MRQTIVIALLALAAAATVLSAEPPQKTSQAQTVAARSLKIGHVDLTRVMKECRQTQDLEKEIGEFRTSLLEQEAALAAKLNRSKLEVQQLAAGTPEYEAAMERYQDAGKELEQFQRNGELEMDRKMLSATEILYSEILLEVQQIGAERDFDLIIKDQTPEVAPTVYNAAVLQISRQIVLYSKPEYDLTAVLVQRLNDKYATKKAGTAELPAEKR